MHSVQEDSRCWTQIASLERLLAEYTDSRSAHAQLCVHVRASEEQQIQVLQALGGTGSSVCSLLAMSPPIAVEVTSPSCTHLRLHDAWAIKLVPVTATSWQ